MEIDLIINGKDAHDACKKIKKNGLIENKQSPQQATGYLSLNKQ